MSIIGLKKTAPIWISPLTKFDAFELDELYSFKNRKKPLEERENLYVMTMISRSPRQIVGFNVDESKEKEKIQPIVDSTPPANRYYTDGNPTYLDVDFLGTLIQNIDDKSDTHNVESVNSDLRHYIPMLARKSRCFPRNTKTLKAVLSVFVNAYNKFGEAKLWAYRPVKHQSMLPNKHLHKFKELPFSILNFL